MLHGIRTTQTPAPTARVVPAERSAIALLEALLIGLCLLALTAGAARAQSPLASRADPARPAPLPLASPAEQSMDRLGRLVSIELEDVSVERALEALAAEAGLSLVMARRADLRARQVSLALDGVTVLEALHAAIRGTDARLMLSPSGYLVVARGAAAPTAAEVPDLRPLFAVSGAVTADGDGSVLPGVNVAVKGTTLGTITDADGFYTLEAPSGTDTLVFSFVGFETAEVPIAGRSVVNVALAADEVALDEVVVIGYGTQRRRDLTGSVTSVEVEDLADVPAISFDQLLAGRAPGLQVTQTSSAPGGAVSLRIRGGNSIEGGNEPLIVIDGFPLYNDDGDLTRGIPVAGGGGQAPNSLTALNPDDIASIEILKDASATAIYGSRGANGVILITTKKGGRDGRAVVNFSASAGVQSVANPLPMLSAAEYAALNREAWINAGRDPATWGGLPTDVDVDHQRELFRSAPMQDYNLSVRGGDGPTSYALSGGYLNHQGVVRGSGLERLSLRSNVERRVGRLTLGTNVTAARVEDDVVINDQRRGAIAGALNMAPNSPILLEDGTYAHNRFPNTGVAEVQFPAMYQARERDFTRSTDRLLANVFATFEVADGLVARTSLGGDLANAKERYHNPRIGELDQGHGILSHNAYRNYVIENTLAYDRDLGENRVSLLAGQTAQRYAQEDLQVFAENLDNLTRYWDLSPNDRLSNNMYSFYSDWSLLSFLGRAIYSHAAGRYVATVSFRADGSSRFGEGRRYGLFPSAAVAWTVSEEPFFRVGAVDNLKLRASVGVTGNQEIGSYKSLARLGSTRAVIGDELALGRRPVQIPNPDLSWESTRQVDFGLDAVLWGGRLTATLDLYHKRTDDLLFDLNVPMTTGFATVTSNVGAMQNRGVELAVGTFADLGGLRWEADANVSLNRNELLRLDGTLDEAFVGRLRYGVLRVGEPVGNFYGYQTDGLFQEGDDIASSAQPDALPGDRRFVDANGDGLINGLDRVVLGSGHPDVLFGLGNTLRAGGFDLSVFVQGVLGQEVYNRTLTRTASLDGRYNNTTLALDRWTPQNPDTDVPRAALQRPDGSVGANAVISDHVEDGSFVRISNLTLGYTLPARLTQSLSGRQVRLYAGVQNLYTFTGYSGFDPEVNSTGKARLDVNVDEFTYPRARTLQLGVNMTF